MNTIHGYFDGIYKNNQERELSVHGSFTTMPGKSSTLLPGTDLLFFHFWATEIGGPVFKPIPIRRAGYIRHIHEEWQVGHIKDNQFQPQTSEFLKWLTGLIVTKYLSLQRDEESPFPGDI